MSFSAPGKRTRETHPPEIEGGGGGAKPLPATQAKKGKLHVSDGPDTMRLVVSAPQCLKHAASSWHSLMTVVNVSVKPSPTCADLGVLEMCVTDGSQHTCVVATVVETGIEHLGANCVGKNISLDTKKFMAVMKEIANIGALQISYDGQATSEKIQMKSVATFSRVKFAIDELSHEGDSDSIPRNVPAKVCQVIITNVGDIGRFITCLSNLGAELLYVQLKMCENDVFLTIGADSSGGSTQTVTADKTFYGTRVTAREGGGGGGASKSQAGVLSGGGVALQSTHLLQLDETVFEHPVCVGEHDNISSAEITDALDNLETSASVVVERHYFMIQFVASFVKGLESKSKLVLAIIKTPSGSPALLLRNRTPKSVSEMMLASVIQDNELE